ncbi:hypothetical protein DYB37_013681, partial [Aphanomyces astaci]
MVHGRGERLTEVERLSIVDGFAGTHAYTVSARKLMRVADGDFQSVEALFGELRTLKHSINSLVSDDLLILMVLGVLPSEFFGAQIVLDTVSFRIEDFETRVFRFNINEPLKPK